MQRTLQQNRGSRSAGFALILFGAWLARWLDRELRDMPPTLAAPPIRELSPGPPPPPDPPRQGHGAQRGTNRRGRREVYDWQATSTEPLRQNRSARVAGVALIACIVWYLPWLFGHADMSKPWIAVPFVVASVLVALSSAVSVVNRWQQAVPERMPVPAGFEPTVAVLIPTLGEPVKLLERTVRSVLDQDWPTDRLWVLVSDDAGDDHVRSMVNRIALAYPEARVRYHKPPGRDDPRRRGEAKAGNLNSAIALVPAEIDFIESRDADDLVGDPQFLREAIGQLVVHARLAFVQTAKTGQVSPHDPFDNQQPHFYRCAMLSRHAANAVFPCGSGVVWRRAALDDIGDFPTWNLVEDLQSGVEALRRGWNGCYLPILGAYAQHSPEDLPNFTKQRGTWALDTVRLNLWAPKRGLSLRQRLQFYELGLFYMQGPATLVFLLVPTLGFATHTYPVVTTTSAFVIHFWPFAVALELYLALVHRRMSLDQLWRARLTWVGLSFVYARSCLLALLGGPTHKPRYVVTRKENQYAWHWRHVFPHIVLLALLVGSMTWSLAHHNLFDSFDVGSAYWAILYSLLMLGFIRLSWHGVPSRSARAAEDLGVGTLVPAEGTAALVNDPGRSGAAHRVPVWTGPPRSRRAHAEPPRPMRGARRGALPGYARHPLEPPIGKRGGHGATLPEAPRLGAGQSPPEAETVESRVLVER
ncbi:MAG: glycosyltransferase [Solirubrobacteraceae bacterium]